MDPPTSVRRDLCRPSEPVRRVAGLLHGNDRGLVVTSLLQDCVQPLPRKNGDVDGQDLERRPLATVAVDGSQDAPRARACLVTRKVHNHQAVEDGLAARHGEATKLRAHLLAARVAPKVERVGRRDIWQIRRSEALAVSAWAEPMRSISRSSDGAGSPSRKARNKFKSRQRHRLRMNRAAGTTLRVGKDRRRKEARLMKAKA